MFHKDTIRLIKNTFNRFFSLLMMVLIGSAFMMGLLSTKLIMKSSVDVFNDENRLHDIQIYSSYGFDDDDIKALVKEENVEYAFPSKQTDILCSINGGTPSVTRVSEAERDVNLLTVTYGRLPEKDNEALILGGNGNDSHYIGKTLTLIDEANDITESFRNTEYTIVGVVKCPEYISKMLGSSNLNNRDLSNVIYIPESNFLQDYYTCIYLTLDNASSYISYTDEYENFVEESVSDIKGFAIEQQEKRKEGVLSDALKELEEGTAEFEEKKAEGEKKLADAKKLLDDSNIKLLFLETTLDTNQATLDASKKEIEKNETLLSINERELNDAIKEIEAQDEAGRSFDEIYSEVQSGYTMYQALKYISESDLPEDSEGEIKALEKQNEELAENVLQYEAELDSLRKELETLPDDSEEKAGIEERIRYYELRVNAANARIAANNAMISQIRASENGSLKETAKEAMKRIDESAGGSIETVYFQLTAVKDGQKKIEEGKAQIESGKAQIEQGEKQLNEGRATLASLRAQYNRGVKEYEDGLYTFTTEIEKAEDELKNAKQKIDELPDASWIFLDRGSHYSSLMYKQSCDQMGSI
ncbi:MAG: hypothetical protein MJ171_01210, partial [Clostridia bacterium]|nr:hypothetical protein [Clostridia bacterium]